MKTYYEVVISEVMVDPCIYTVRKSRKGGGGVPYDLRTCRAQHSMSGINTCGQGPLQAALHLQLTRLGSLVPATRDSEAFTFAPSCQIVRVPCSLYDQLNYQRCSVAAYGPHYAM